MYKLVSAHACPPFGEEGCNAPPATDSLVHQMSRADIENQIIMILEDMTQDWGVDRPIAGNACLVADLDFESIDVIQMVVAIEQHFDNRNLRFDQLLMNEGRYVSDLSVQQIANFVASRL